MYSTLPWRTMFRENLTWHPASCWCPDNMGTPDHYRSHTSQKSILRPPDPPAGFHPRCAASPQLYIPNLKQALVFNLYTVIFAMHSPWEVRKEAERKQRKTKEEAGVVPRHQQVDRERDKSGSLWNLILELRQLSPLLAEIFKNLSAPKHISVQKSNLHLQAEQTNPGLSISLWSLQPKCKQAY